MLFSTALVAFTAALGGVSAHPSPRAHAHANAHRARDVEFKKSVPHTAVPEVSPQVAKEQQSKSNDASSSTDSSSGGVGFQPFCGGKNTKRATKDQIMYAGNVGTKDNWGCNMKVIDAADAKHYDYTTKFSGTGEKYTCSCFNKVGPKGLLDGFWFSALDFTVSEAGKDDVYMAFDKNSQGGCACSPGDKVDRTIAGQLSGTWLEFDWGSEPNGGNSGADASVLVPGAQVPPLPYYGMKVSANGKTCSWVKSDGSNEAAYMPGMEDFDGVGCKGYYKGNLDVLLGDNFST